MLLDLRELGNGGHELFGTDHQDLLLGNNPVDDFLRIHTGLIKHLFPKLDPRLNDNADCRKGHNEDDEEQQRPDWHGI